MNTEQAARLANLDQQFQGAPIAGRANTVPANNYHAVIDRFDFVDTQKGLKLKTEMSVAVGPYAGAKLETWHDLEDPDKFQYLKGHLTSMGLEVPDSLSVLDAVLAKALDVPVDVTVKVTAEGYVNVYVNRTMGPPMRPVSPAGRVDEAPWPDETSNVSTDDVPF